MMPEHIISTQQILASIIYYYFYYLTQGQQTFSSMKGQIVNTLGFMGQEHIQGHYVGVM